MARFAYRCGVGALIAHGAPLPHHPDRPQQPKIRQSRERDPSTVNERTVADFTRVVEQTGILKREPLADRPPED